MTARKYPAVIILLFLVAGIVLADIIKIPCGVYLFTALTAFLTGVALYQYRMKRAAVIVFLVGFLALSGFNFAFRYKAFPPGHVKHFVDNNQKYIIYAEIDDWPVLYEHKTILYARLDSLRHEDHVIPGKGRLIINIAVPTTRIQYGDRLIWEACLFAVKGGANPSGLDYRRYLNLKGVFGACYLPHDLNIRVNPAGKYDYHHVIQNLRQEILEIFQQTLKPPHAAVASGFFLGETRNIPEHIYAYFRDSGTLHLLAVSGSNVWLLVGLIALLLMASNLNPRRKAIILIAFVIIFSSLAQNQPSVVRASVMAILVLIGKALQRRIELNNIIAAAADLILAAAPAQLFDIGFQLSFVVAWALVFMTPRILAHIKINKERKYINWLIFPVVISFIAQAASMPLIAYYFGRVTFISFAANLIIVPLNSLIVIGEMVLLLAYTLLPLLGQLIGIPLNALFDLNLYLLELFGSKSTLEPCLLSFSGWMVILFLVVLTLGTLAIDSKRARRHLVFLLIISGCIWAGSRLNRLESDYRLTVFSLARGNMVVCEGEKTNYLFMADLTEQEYILAEKTAVPYLKNKGVRNLSIISLTPDYATLQEAVATAQLFDTVQLYVPEKSQGLIADIMRLNNPPTDAYSVLYFSDTIDFETIETGTAGIREGLAFLRFDSLVVLILSENSDLPFVPGKSPALSGPILMIKPILVPSDTLFLNETNLSLLVCRDISRIPRKSMGMAPYYQKFLPKIWLTSQKGAADISIYRGRPTLPD